MIRRDAPGARAKMGEEKNVNETEEEDSEGEIVV